MHSAAETQIPDLHKKPKAWSKLSKRAVKNLKLQLQPNSDQLPVTARSGKKKIQVILYLIRFIPLYQSLNKGYNFQGSN